MRESREQLVAEFSLRYEESQLQTYIRTVSTALMGPKWFQEAPISELAQPLGRLSLTNAAELAAQRFGIAVSGLELKLADLGGPAGRVHLANGRALVEVDSQYQNDPEAVAVIVAHEFAHLVLGVAGVKLQAQIYDEELADAAVVLVGFGPLMLRVCYQEHTWKDGERAMGSIRRVGYLNPVAVAYLTLVQAELAGLPQAQCQALAGQWGEKPLAHRKQAWKTFGEQFQERQAGDDLNCVTCGTRLRIPNQASITRIRCPVCSQKQPQLATERG